MNRAELRRLLTVVLMPAVAIAAVLVTVVMLHAGSDTAVAPGRIGEHWHATYQISVCGERQPNAPAWEGGVHTHADGVIHIHPFTPSEEGRGARLVKWFEYGGGWLTQTSMRVPGSRDSYQNGDRCPDGLRGVIQVSVNGERLGDWSEYIPQDGDRITIVFGPEGESPSTH